MKGQETASFQLYYYVTAGCGLLSSVEQAHMIQVSIDSGSNLSMYHTVWLDECLAR